MFIVMDLEFNCSNNNYVSEKNGIRLPNEIIEIGAVKVKKNKIELFIKTETHPCDPPLFITKIFKII